MFLRRWSRPYRPWHRYDFLLLCSPLPFYFNPFFGSPGDTGAIRSVRTWASSTIMCAPVLLLYKLITIAHRCASRSKLPSRVAPHPCLLGSRGLLTRHDCVRGGRMYGRRWAPLRARKFWLATNSANGFPRKNRVRVCVQVGRSSERRYFWQVIRDQQ